MKHPRKPRLHPLRSGGLTLAIGVLLTLLAGCSVQKRTTTHGFHIEQRAARLHVPVAPVSAETHGLPGCNRMSAPEQAEGLKRLTPKTIQPSEAFEVSRRSIFPMNGVLSPDSSATVSEAPESRREKLKNSILAVLGRSNNLDTASQVIDVPPAQLEELREEARKASKWNFLLGLLHLPWSIISRRGLPHLPRNRILGVGLVLQTVGPRRRQVARLGRTASAGATTSPKPNMVAMAAHWPRRRQPVCASLPVRGVHVWLRHPLRGFNVVFNANEWEHLQVMVRLFACVMPKAKASDPSEPSGRRKLSWFGN